MNIFKKSIIFIEITTIFFANSAMAGSTQFTVNGMVCAFCAQGIENKLVAMPETAAVYIDLAKKIVVVEAKSGAVIPAEQVAHEIKDAGYDVSKIEKSNLTVSEIKAAVSQEKKNEE